MHLPTQLRQPGAGHVGAGAAYAGVVVGLLHQLAAGDPARAGQVAGAVFLFGAHVEQVGGAASLGAPVVLPDPLPVTERHKSRQQMVVDLIRREKPTAAQLLRTLGAGGHRLLVGTPSQIVEVIACWYEERAADGFNLLFTHLPGGLECFVDLVIPELLRLGLFRREYEGRTLRENLGLQRVANRHFA